MNLDVYDGQIANISYVTEKLDWKKDKIAML
jgi:hypothetical protein